MKTSLVALFNPDPTRPYGVAILNEWKADLIPALRAANPNVKVLLYKNASFLREDDNASTVGGYKTAPESWFLHDAAGDHITRLVYGVRAHMMDPGNELWRSWWAVRANGQADRLGFNGLFADDCYTKMYGEVGTAAGYTDATYQLAVRGFLARAKSVMLSSTLVANLVEHLWYPDLWADWLTVVDGLMDEHFIHVGTDPATGFKTAADWWDRQVRQVEECERQGKMGLFISRGLPTDLKTMNYCWASYLLGAGEHTHFAHYAESYNNAPWWPEWGHNFGEPAGLPFRVHDGDTWSRDFQGGHVSVDPRRGMSRIDEIRARVAGIRPEDMSLHERDCAFLLDLVERALGLAHRGGCLEHANNCCAEWCVECRDGIDNGRAWSQWLEDVRGAEG